MSSTGQSPEEIQPEDWAGEMGERWNQHIDQFESMLTAVGSAAIEFAGFKKNESVLDVGCGGGETTIEIARLVGDGGKVTGVDVSPVLIRTAESRRNAAGLTNVEFVEGDAATMTFQPSYDCVFSRFGVMFFDDCYAAFRNLASAVAPGGRAALCCWGPPPANPWITSLLEIVGRHVELPPRDPRAPGPFALADREYFTDILDKAGFRDPEFTAWKGDLYLGGVGADAETAAEFVLTATFLREMLEDQPAESKQTVANEIVAMLREHESERGVTMKGTSWLVAARV